MQFRGSEESEGAFTLTELLVTVAIIAVLIGIALPVISIQTRVSKAAKCTSNLRELGKALVLYATENNGFLPPSYANPGIAVENVGERDWYQYLYHRSVATSQNDGVLPNPNFRPNSPKLLTVYHCPSNPNRIGMWSTPSYAYSQALGITNGTTVKRARISSLESSSKTVFLVDAGVRSASSQSNVNGPSSILCYVTTFAGSTYYWEKSVNFDVHEGYAKFLLADGHVESLDKGEVKRRGEDKTLLWSRDNSTSMDAYW